MTLSPSPGTVILDECSECGTVERLRVLGPNDGKLELTHDACGQSTYLEMED